MPAFFWEAEYFQICGGVPNPPTSVNPRLWRPALQVSPGHTSILLSSAGLQVASPGNMPLRRDSEPFPSGVSPVGVSLDLMENDQGY